MARKSTIQNDSQPYTCNGELYFILTGNNSSTLISYISTQFLNGGDI